MLGKSNEISRAKQPVAVIKIVVDKSQVFAISTNRRQDLV
jgi:hypothetical protein